MAIGCVLRTEESFLYLKLFRPAYFVRTNQLLPHTGHELWQVLHIRRFNVMIFLTTVFCRMVNEHVECIKQALASIQAEKTATARTISLLKYGIQSPTVINSTRVYLECGVR